MAQGFFLDAYFVQYLTSWLNTRTYTACFHEGLFAVTAQAVGQVVSHHQL